MLVPVVKEVTDYLGDVVYGVDVPNLETVCMTHLKEKGWTFATAESCTGGQIAARITALSGASSVYRGGVVSYWTSVKAEVLGVPQTLLDQYGAVSEECARSMAENAGGSPELTLACPSPAWPVPDPGRAQQPGGTGVCGSGVPRWDVVPEAGVGQAPPGSHSGSGCQPRLRYAAPLPDWTAGGAKRHRKTHGKAVKRDENRK